MFSRVVSNFRKKAKKRSSSKDKSKNDIDVTMSTSKSSPSLKVRKSRAGNVDYYYNETDDDFDSLMQSKFMTAVNPFELMSHSSTENNSMVFSEPLSYPSPISSSSFGSPLAASPPKYLNLASTNCVVNDDDNVGYELATPTNNHSIAITSIPTTTATKLTIDHDGSTVNYSEGDFWLIVYIFLQINATVLSL